jgi:1,4-dihydroxy-6-naphthoate synthase
MGGQLMKIKLVFSPCPNDCFIFDALVNGKIETGPYQFEVFMEDVQTLNEWAEEGKLEVTKLSYYALGKLLEKYAILPSGGAMGFGCGPLVISARPGMALDGLQPSHTVALPGELTTANLLFSLRYPRVTKKVFMVFSEIEEAVISGKVDAGVIIHENRFTFRDKGLFQVTDLGTWWERFKKSPIPLGGIGILRSLGKEHALAINLMIRQSVFFAFNNPESATTYVAKHASEMSPEIQKLHIQTYVNDFSLDPGTGGEKAVKELFAMAHTEGLIPPPPAQVFF